jgi:hypothetical protein
MSIFANSYGNFLSSALPFYQAMPGIVTPFGTLLKPGGRIAAYVRSTGAQDGEDHFASSGMLVSTLQAGLARCRSGQGDIVYVLPGHTESITGADFMTNLVAGTQIISAGKAGSTNNPTFTWTATTSTFLLDVADVSLIGLTLNMGGADNVTAPITVTGAGCMVAGCHIISGISSVLESATPITVSTAANDCLITANRFTATGGAVTTACVSVAAAVARTTITGNRFFTTQSSATTGVVSVGAAATELDIGWNLMYNQVEDGVGIRVANVACTGLIYNNYFGGVDAGGTVANALKAVSFAGTAHIIRMFENRATDEDSGTGVISQAAATS